MKLLLVPLLIMFASSIFSASLNFGSTTLGTSNTTGTSSQTTTFTFGVPLSLSVIVIFGALIFIALIFGLNLLGSGFTAGSARTMIILIGLFGLWILLTGTGAKLITDILPPAGTIAYLALTIVYVVGAIQTVSGQGGGGN